MHLRQIKHSKPRPRKVPWSATSITVSCWLEESSRFRTILSKHYLETFDKWLHRNSVSLAIPVGETPAFDATVDPIGFRIAGQVEPASTDLDRIITWRSDKD